jgi:hypothetical protein
MTDSNYIESYSPRGAEHPQNSTPVGLKQRARFVFFARQTRVMLITIQARTFVFSSAV